MQYHSQEPICKCAAATPVAEVAVCQSPNVLSVLPPAAVTVNFCDSAASEYSSASAATVPAMQCIPGRIASHQLSVHSYVYDAVEASNCCPRPVPHQQQQHMLEQTQQRLLSVQAPPCGLLCLHAVSAEVASSVHGSFCTTCQSWLEQSLRAKCFCLQPVLSRRNPERSATCCYDHTKQLKMDPRPCFSPLSKPRKVRRVSCSETWYKNIKRQYRCVVDVIVP